MAPRAEHDLLGSPCSHDHTLHRSARTHAHAQRAQRGLKSRRDGPEAPERVPASGHVTGHVAGRVTLRDT